MIERKGLFCALYSRPWSHFWLTPKAAARSTRSPYAARPGHEGIGSAYDPVLLAASAGTLGAQLRYLAGTAAAGVAIARDPNSRWGQRVSHEDYIAEFNRRFTVPRRQRGTAFLSCRNRDLEMVFTQRYERTVDRDNTVRFHNLVMQLERAHWRPTLAGCKVDHPPAPGHHLDSDDRWTSHRTLQRGRKAPYAAEQKTNQGRGKDVGWKSQKADFPTPLANPAHYAGFTLSHHLYGY